MKRISFLAALVMLSGCVEVRDYQQVTRQPAPSGLSGYWQTDGPQSELVSPEAIASLVVTAQGDTLDCRQWQRVIARQGKLARFAEDGEIHNVTVDKDIYSLSRNGDNLRYAGMSMKRVPRPTEECREQLTHSPLASPLPN